MYEYSRICCISNKNTNKFNNSLVNIIYMYIFSMLVAHYSYLSHHINFAESYICFICFSSIKYKCCRGLEVVVQLCTPVCTISEISRACFARGHDAITDSTIDYSYSIDGQRSGPGGNLSCIIAALDLYRCTVTDSLWNGSKNCSEHCGSATGAV